MPPRWDQLLEKMTMYQELGADRMVIGIPTDEIGDASRGLAALATLIDRFA